MKNFDTISLLKACNQGCKYATNGIENLYSYIKNDDFRDLVDEYLELLDTLNFEKCIGGHAPIMTKEELYRSLK